MFIYQLMLLPKSFLTWLPFSDISQMELETCEGIILSLLSSPILCQVAQRCLDSHREGVLCCSSVAQCVQWDALSRVLHRGSAQTVQAAHIHFLNCVSSRTSANRHRQTWDCAGPCPLARIPDESSGKGTFKKWLSS